MNDPMHRLLRTPPHLMDPEALAIYVRDVRQLRAPQLKTRKIKIPPEKKPRKPRTKKEPTP